VLTFSQWLSLVNLFVAPFFILILIGVTYQLGKKQPISNNNFVLHTALAHSSPLSGVFVATERQNSISELMAAQRVTNTPRILSTIVSFLILYFPGFLACSIILTQVLFTRTSAILFLFLTLLAGTSLTVSSHFLASFFSKAQLSGLYISVLVFALAIITLADTLTAVPKQAQVIGLALVFPPITWTTLISDVSQREYNLMSFGLDSLNTTLSKDANAFYSNSPTQ
jgi:ATP-binding cassette subfamily A (ABC1) protein 3